MSDKDHVSGGGFVGLQPRTEVVAGHVQCLVGLISWVYLGMHHMTFGQRLLEIVVHMSRKRLERGISPLITVDIDNQKSTSPIVVSAIKLRRH